MMRVVVFLGSVCLLGCSGGAPPPGASGTPDITSLSVDPIAATKAREIGDVVSHMRLTTRLDLRSKFSSIKNTEQLTRIKDLTLVNIEVSEPLPEELWIAITLLSKQNFPGSVVLVKGSIFVDYKELKTFTHVTGAQASIEPMQTSFDLLAEFDDVPESVLVHASATVSLFEGDDPSAINPETAVAPRENTQEIESNPARITFVQ